MFGRCSWPEFWITKLAPPSSFSKHILPKTLWNQSQPDHTVLSRLRQFDAFEYKFSPASCNSPYFRWLAAITLHGFILLGYSVKMISAVGSYASENSILVIQGYTPYKRKADCVSQIDPYQGVRLQKNSSYLGQVMSFYDNVYEMGTRFSF